MPMIPMKEVGKRPGRDSVLPRNHRTALVVVAPAWDLPIRDSLYFSRMHHSLETHARRSSNGSVNSSLSVSGDLPTIVLVRLEHAPPVLSVGTHAPSTGQLPQDSALAVWGTTVRCVHYGEQARPAMRTL